MISPLPQHLIEEQAALEAEIRTAFKGVSREGGVSWSESNEMSMDASDAVLAAARASDTDKSWEDLLNDPNWTGYDAYFIFLDAIGFRYYLAPAMIRWLRQGPSHCTSGNVFSMPFAEDAIRLMSANQRSAVKRFLRFMIAFDLTDEQNYWQKALDKHLAELDKASVSD